MARDFNVNQMATAVMWWLSYTSAMGRNYVLSESAIKFPVAEYLERSTTSLIDLESEHPKLSMRRFDIAFKTEASEHVAFEFKYIKNGSTRSTDEKQRVFNDLMRLYLYLEVGHRGYFLICGNQFDFIPNFQKIEDKRAGATYITPVTRPASPPGASGFYTEWFNFEGDPRRSIDLKTRTGGYKDIYDGFLKEYAEPYSRKTGSTLALPANLTTKRIFLSEDIQQVNGLFQPAKIGIWEIIKTT